MKKTVTRCLLFLLSLLLLPALPMLVKQEISGFSPLGLCRKAQGFSFSFASGGQDGFPGFFGLFGINVPDSDGASDSSSDASALSRLPASGQPASPSQEATPEPEESETLRLPEFYRVLDAKTGIVMELTPNEYILGVTAAELPSSFEVEAVKAQAVAAHTYALRQMGLAQKTQDPALKGAFLSTDPAHYQAYFAASERKAHWGEQYEENEEKFSKAVDEVIHEVLTYNGEPIAAAFHSISSGKTESAQDVWGQPLPYLIPADSKEDLENSRVEAFVIKTSKEVSEALKFHIKDVVLPEEPAKWLSVASRSDSGAVLEVKAAKSSIQGSDLREWLSLPSANFEISYKDGQFTFLCKGRGHGVGLSQYGADAMAKEGKTYREILFHYYAGVSLHTLS